MALKRVCDITGTDRDVEICDVTIAGQMVKLDLSPSGVEKLREFFGPVVSVQHPAQAAGSDPASQDTQTQAAEEEAEQAEVEAEAEAAQALDEVEAVPVAVVERAARRNRRPAPSAKSTPKKSQRGQQRGSQKASVSRHAAASITPGTSEIREWARANGFEIGERGAIPGRIRSAYTLAHE